MRVFGSFAPFLCAPSTAACLSMSPGSTSAYIVGTMNVSILLFQNLPSSSEYRFWSFGRFWDVSLLSTFLVAGRWTLSKNVCMQYTGCSLAKALCGEIVALVSIKDIGDRSYNSSHIGFRAAVLNCSSCMKSAVMNVLWVLVHSIEPVEIFPFSPVALSASVTPVSRSLLPLCGVILVIEPYRLRVTSVSSRSRLLNNNHNNE